MARLARKQLADSRAMEEESLRMSLHGGSKYVGRGATPSMGLSQFRGGMRGCPCGRTCSCKEESSSDEEDMKGGRRSLLSRLPGAGLSRGRPVIRMPTLPTISRPPTSRPYAEIPSFPRPNLYPGRGAWFGPRLVNTPRGVKSAVSKLGLPPGKQPRTMFNAKNATRVAALLAAGVPFAMLGAYLGDMGADDGGGGYYDDYAGEEGAGPSAPDADGDGIPDDIDPDADGDGIPDGYAPPDGGPGGMGGLPEDIADQLTRTELAFYLQSGNLPSRFYQQSKRGKGKGMKRKPSARNEIVKQVMRERGVSLPQASKIVKAEGLYRK